MNKHILGLALLALAANASARSYGELEFEPCSLAPDFAPTVVEAQCTRLAVPLDHEAPEGATIELAIAWIPSDGEVTEDPVFMLAGGPGQSARESYPMVAQAFREVRRSRHIVLVDQRGTGDSHPLVCRDEDGESAVAEDALELDPARAREFAERCLASLDTDPRFFTTGDAIRDLDAVRRAIGAASINLVGISYGTRVAQQYAARYPEHTRAIVLDSVVPNTLVLGAEHARNLEAALALQFERCREDEACTSAFGDPAADLAELKTRLRAEPREVVFRDPITGEQRSEQLGFGHLAGILRLYAYQPGAAALLPLILHEAREGRADTLMAQAEMLFGQLGDQIMHGMQLSVMCAEDVDELQADPADADSVLGTDLVEFSQAQCAVWPRGRRDEGFRQPLATDVPALLLSGELDPVTPPRYGDEVAGALENGRHLVLPHQGHSVLGAGCMPRLLAQFLETTDAAGLEADCLDRLPAIPPFSGFHGWEP